MKVLLKKLFKPVEEFLRLEAASGILLAACTVLAMIIANSPLKYSYFDFLHIYVFGLSIHHWINDGLMAIFFFVVGMEIKRELMVGELSTPRKAALPIAAAIGGMLGPALIFYSLNPTGPNAAGWGIPMATDIAFAVAVLTLFGRRVPFPLKIFLLALAIVDDLGAVLVIAFFYTQEIAGWALGLATFMFLIIFLTSRFGVRSYSAYVVLGAVAWYAILRSGVHATIAGVLLGFFTPLQYPKFRESQETFSPLEDLVYKLHPWVSFGIMPIFALANAGVDLSGMELAALLENTVARGVGMGLTLGKPVGILVACLMAVSFGLAQLPNGVRWPEVLGVGFLGGVGFTMALFISNLALPKDVETYSKAGILGGSLLSAIIGAGILAYAFRDRDNPANEPIQ